LLATSYAKAQVQRQPEKEKELVVLDQLGQDLNRYLRPSSRDEYQDYINQPPYDIGEMTALQWWGLEPQRIRYPRLSLMAFDILSIPAMSDELERVFLGACRTITWDKAQMKPDTIEMRECLKHWKKSKILNQIVIED
jgi:hypothetical protein